MIISASYRTDIPAFYSDWFRNRLAAGFVRVTNPYGGPPATVELSAASAAGFVFWTRNIAPLFGVLDDLHAAGRPFVVQYTLTGYPRELDAATIPPGQAIAHLRRIAAEYGPRVGVWRYDPVLFSELTPPAHHVAVFRALCRELAGVVDEVVLSVAQIYRKTARNLNAAALAGGFAWQDPDAAEKRALLSRLARIAAGHGITASLCGQPDLAGEGLAEAQCIDADRLADVAARPLPAVHKPHRATCSCWASKDIGAYDSCPHGCAYCYAVASRAAAGRNRARHDPAGAFLLPPRRGA